jgi:hypothetical protein
MAWEWVAPVAAGVSGSVGVFFTWLAGSQGRKHAERMVDQSQAAEHRARLQKERHDAYFAAMRVVDLDIRRVRYKQEEMLGALAQIEQYWTKSKRVEMYTEAEIALYAYGSDEVRGFAEAWRVAVEDEDLGAMQELADRFRSQMRAELQEG